MFDVDICFKFMDGSTAQPPTSRYYQQDYSYLLSSNYREIDRSNNNYSHAPVINQPVLFGDHPTG